MKRARLKSRRRKAKPVPPAKRLELFLSRNRAVVKAVTIFVAGIVLITIALSRLMQGDGLSAFTGFTARATGFFLNLFRAHVDIDGSLITSGDLSMIIIT